MILALYDIHVKGVHEHFKHHKQTYFFKFPNHKNPFEAFLNRLEEMNFIPDWYDWATNKNGTVKAWHRETNEEVFNSSEFESLEDVSIELADYIFTVKRSDLPEVFHQHNYKE